MKFKASLDKFTFITTLLVTALLITSAVIQFIFVKEINFGLGLFISILILLGFIIAFLYKPYSYSIEIKQIKIHRYINVQQYIKII